MNNDSVTILNDLQRSLVSFFDELIDMFPREGDFVVIRMMIKDRIPVSTIMNYFIKTVLPEKASIGSRSESVFLDKNILFSSFGPLRSDNFKKLWIGDNLDKDDKACLWVWLDTFISLVEKYQKLNKN